MIHFQPQLSVLICAICGPKFGQAIYLYEKITSIIINGRFDTRFEFGCQSGESRFYFRQA